MRRRAFIAGAAAAGLAGWAHADDLMQIAQQRGDFGERVLHALARLGPVGQRGVRAGRHEIGSETIFSDRSETLPRSTKIVSDPVSF
jgi:hypothetical protein